MTYPITIIQATASHGAVLAGLHAECFAPAWTSQTFVELLAMPGASAWIGAVANAGEPAGFLLTRTAAGEAEVLTIGVVPSRRRAGLALAMMEHAFAYLAAASAEIVFIEVAEDNSAALDLYAAMGFENAGLRKAYYDRPGERPGDALVMRRRL